MEFSSLHRHPFHLRDGQRRPDTLRACPESLSTPVTEQFDLGPLTFYDRMDIPQGSRSVDEKDQHARAFASCVH